MPMAANSNPNPDPRESLLGFLMRRADMAKLKSVRSLLTAAGISFEFTRDSELVRLFDVADQLALHVRVPADDLRRIGYAPTEPGDDRRGAVVGFGGQTITRKGIDIERLRVCPACLDEEWMAKAVWDLPAICACPKHGCRLVERCPVCRIPINAMRCAPHVCRCGAPLRRAPRVDADPLAVGLCLRLHASLGRDVDGVPVEDLGEPFDFMELTRLIGALHLMQIPKGGRRAPEMFHRRSPEEMESVLVRAAHMLEDWPASLHQLCDEAEPVRWGGRMLPPSIESGRPYQVIDGLPMGAAKNFLKDAWAARPGGTGRSLPPREELLRRRRRDGLTLLTRGEARQVLGISDKGLDVLERSGRLSRRPPVERNHAIWDIEEVEVLAGEGVVLRDRRPSVKRELVLRLAGIVGIDLRGAQRMILTCEMPPFDLVTMTGSGAKAVVDRLEDWMKGTLTGVPTVVADECVVLDVLVQAHGRFRGLDRGTALALLLSGHLVPDGRKGEQDSVADLLFPRTMCDPMAMTALIDSELRSRSSSPRPSVSSP